jgi:hypothetical protein
MFLVAISLRKNITGFFVGLAAMEVIARALDRSAFAHILYATGNTVRGHKKAAFRYLQQSMQFILPAILVFLITNKIKSEFRCEKLLLLYIFDLMFLRSNMDVKCILEI